MSKQGTIKIDVLANVERFQTGVHQIQQELSKLRLSPELDNSIDVIISNLQKKIQRFYDLTEGNQLNLLDEKELQNTFNKIDSAWSQLARKLQSKGVLTAELKEGNTLLTQLTQIQSDYTKQVKDINKELEDENAKYKKQKGLLEQINQKNPGKTFLPKEERQAREKELKSEIEAIQQAITKSKEYAEVQKILAAKQEKGTYKDVNLFDANSKGFGQFFGKNGPAAGFDKLKQKIIETTAQTKPLRQELDSLASRGDYTRALQAADGAKERIEALKKQLQDLENQQNETIQKQISQLEGVDWAQYGIDPASIQSYEDLERVIEQLSAEGKTELATTLTTIKTLADQAGDEMDDLSGGILKAHESVKELTESQKQVEQFAHRLLSFFSIDNAVSLFKRSLRGAYEAVKELDAAMTEMAVVTELDVSDYWDQLPQYTKQANELGVATKAVYEAATLYYQQGLKSAQVNQLTSATLKMARIAGLDAAEATDRMTNALRGFNMEINQTNADRVADVYSKLAAITASNVDEISTAMTKTASIASNAGMAFETTAAFLSQIIETTRESAETAGTALKTVIARFQELKKDPAEIGEVEGEIVDANKVETALRSVGIALRDSEGQFRNLDEVFLDLSAKWNSLDKNTQRYIATIAAGSRQQSRFIAMMSNYEHTMELVNAANNSAGAAQQQYEKTLESLQSKVDRLRNAWHEFVMGLANSTLIKGAVDLLTGLINGVNKLTEGWDGASKGILRLGAAIIGLRAGYKLLWSVLPKIVKYFELADTWLGKMVASHGKKAAATVADTAATEAHAAALKDEAGAAIAAADAYSLNNTAKASAAAALGNILAIGAALAVVAGLIYAIYSNSNTGKLKKIQKDLQELEEEANKSQTALEGLTNGLNKLEDTYKNLDSLTKGTQEWRQAVQDTNTAVLDLIANYPALMQFATLKDGIWTINTDDENIQQLIDNAKDQALRDQQKVTLKRKEENQQQQIINDEKQLSALGYGSADEVSKKIIQEYANKFNSGKSLEDLYDEAIEKFTNGDLTSEENVAYQQLVNSLGMAINSMNSETEEEQQYYKQLIQDFNKYNNFVAENNNAQKGYNNTLANTVLELSGINEKDQRNGTENFEQIYRTLASGDWFDKIYQDSGKDLEKANNEAIARLKDFANSLKTNNKILSDDWLKNILSGNGLTLEQLDEIPNLEKDILANLPTALKDLYKDNEGALVDIIKNAKEVAEEQHTKANEIFENFGLQDTFANFTSEARFALATNLKQVAIELGNTTTTQFSYLLLNITKDLTDKTRQQFLNILNSIDWTQDDAVEQLQTQLQQAGIRINNTDGKFAAFIEKFAELNKQLQTLSLEQFKEKIESLRITLESVQDKAAEGSATFTREEYDQIVAAGGDANAFVQLRSDEFVYLEDLTSLVQAIYNKIPETDDSYIKKLEEKIAVGTTLNELMNTPGDLSSANLTALHSWANGEIDIEEETKNAVMAGAQEVGLLEKDLKPENLTVEDLEVTLTQAWAETYGLEGAAWFQNQTEYENEAVLAKQYEYARLGDAQNILNADVFSQNDLEARSAVLEGIVKKVEGLPGAVKDITKALKSEKDGWQLNDDIINGHVHRVHNANEQIKTFIDELGNYTNALDYEGEPSTAIIEQQNKIASLGQKFFGETFDAEAVRKYRKELSLIAEGGEEAEAAWKSMTASLEEDMLKANYPEKFEQIKTLIDQLDLTGTVRLDTQDAYKALLSILGNAEAVQKALQFRATITYDNTTNGPITGFKIDGKVYQTLGEAKDVADTLGLDRKTIERVRSTATAIATEKDPRDFFKDLSGDGSGSVSKWENPYDWLYNLTEEIVEKTRERNRLERAYTRLLNRNVETVRDASKYYQDQLDNLDQQRQKQQEMYDKRRYIEMPRVLQQYSDLSQYAGWNEAEQRIVIDWDKIDRVTDTELGERIEKYVSKLEFIQDEMEQAEDALWDIETDVQEMKDQAIENYLSFEQRLATALQQIDQDALDAEKKTQEAINNARSDLVEAVQKNIDQIRKDRQNAKTEDQITKLEKQIAYLRQDTSGANQSRISELEEQLFDLTESYGDTLVDDALTNMQEQNEAAAEQRDRQLQYQQDLIDYNARNAYYAEAAYDLIEAASAPGYILTKDSEIYQAIFKGEHWDSQSGQARMNSFNDLLQELTDATVAIQQGLVVNNNTDYSAQWFEAAQRYKEAKSRGDKAAMENIEQEMYNIEYARDEKIRSDKNSKYSTTNGDWTKSFIKGDVSNVPTFAQDLLRSPETPSTDNPGNNNPQANPNRKYIDDVNALLNKTQYHNINAKEGTKAQRQELQRFLAERWGYNDNIDGSYGPNTIAAVKRLQSALNITMSQNDVQQWLKQSGTSFVPLGVDGNFGAKTQQVLKTFANFLEYGKKYKTGGLVTSTGLAWLDGTNAHPEIVLNARDSENLIQLRDILRGDSSMNGHSLGNNYYTIDINVDQLSSDYDVDQVANRIKQIIYNDAMYRNVNAVGIVR